MNLCSFELYLSRQTRNVSSQSVLFVSWRTDVSSHALSLTSQGANRLSYNAVIYYILHQIYRILEVKLCTHIHEKIKQRNYYIGWISSVSPDKFQVRTIHCYETHKPRDSNHIRFTIHENYEFGGLTEWLQVAHCLMSASTLALTVCYLYRVPSPPLPHLDYLIACSSFASFLHRFVSPFFRLTIHIFFWHFRFSFFAHGQSVFLWIHLFPSFIASVFNNF